MRIYLLLLACLIMANVVSAQAQPEDARLAAFFKSYLDESFRLRPMEATRLGDHRYDDLLDDLSLAAHERWVEHCRKTLDQLPAAVDYQKLSRAGQIDFEILRQDLTRSLWLAANTHPLQEDPRHYNEYINDSVYLLLTQSTLPHETNVANCLSRMAQIPNVLAAARANLKNPPRVHTETAIKQNKGAIAFYEQDLFEAAGKTRQLPALKKAAAEVAAALKDYQRFLEADLLPRANGEWRLGPEKFGQKLELTLDAGLTAAQVLADAEAEFTRVERDMYVLSRQLWSHYFPKAPLPPDDVDGRRFTVQKVLKSIQSEHSHPENLVRDIRKDVAQVKKFLADGNIVPLPSPDRCQIIEMPEFQRGNSTAFMNSPPPLDTNAAGFYAVSPPPKDWDAQRVKSYLEEYNSRMLHILTIHEAFPGHYVQLEYANRHPSLIRKVLDSGVFVEGWAVYTEQMMLDQGYGDGDPALRLQQLKFYLRAVANAILDHKMHCTSMSDDEALQFLAKGAFQSEGEARLKIIRSKQSSCQLSTYFVGRMAHYRLRQQIERELGDSFNLSKYHQAVISQGPLPVKYLPELVRASLSKTDL